MEQIEKQFINSYHSILAKEGKEICKEIESLFDGSDKLIIEKCYTYCKFISSLDGVDPELYEKCQNYKDSVNIFNNFEFTLRRVNNSRK